MSPLKIQYELKKRGITQKQIADEEGKSEMTVSQTIRRKITSRPMMEAISRRIGEKPEIVFPDKYGKAQRKRCPKAA